MTLRTMGMLNAQTDGRRADLQQQRLGVPPSTLQHMAPPHTTASPLEHATMRAAHTLHNIIGINTLLARPTAWEFRVAAPQILGSDSVLRLPGRHDPMHPSHLPLNIRPAPQLESITCTSTLAAGRRALFLHRLRSGSTCCNKTTRTWTDVREWQYSVLTRCCKSCTVSACTWDDSPTPDTGQAFC
eukprot:365705-Chlamydomonas_euryale.AAC.4